MTDYRKLLIKFIESLDFESSEMVSIIPMNNNFTEEEMVALEEILAEVAK